MKKLLFFTILIFSILIGCNDEDDADNRPPNQIQMNSGSFVPQTLTIPAGTAVRWVNSSSVNHTVTSSSELFDEPVAPGEDFTYTFTTAGTYNYVCTIHAGMSGTVVVQ